MIRSYKGLTPKIPDSSYVFPTAAIIGNVELGERVIIYPGCVIRAEYGKVTIGDETNVQENTSIHVEDGLDVTIGKGTTLGHNCILHGCTVGDHVLIGMGAVVQDAAVINNGAYIGAGALIKKGSVIPEGYVAFGFPAKAVRPVEQAEMDDIRLSTEEYQDALAEMKRQDC